MDIHRLLDRQIKKSFGGTYTFSELSPELQTLLLQVNNTYIHFDKDRSLIERSLELSSKELNQMNRKLREEVETVNKRTEELERLNRLMIGRELSMVELKKELQRLQSKEPTS